ncbi:MAG: ABC transporter ATP-binding protein [Acidobacteriota bacterium]|jgi:ABC-2 type transport system ATP-binding protein
MIRFKGVHFSYRRGEPVLKGADLDIGAGLTLVLGPNGSGKSTLLKLASGIERPDHGIAEIEGHDLWKDEVAARRALAYVSEQPDLTPYATIRDVIHLVCRLRSQPLQRGREVLERVGLWQIANRSIRELSSGQRRRAVLAAAWIGSPRVVLLDEPLESMDRTIRVEICAWIERLLSEEAAVVIATHEIEPFLEKAARALLVSGGACMLFEPLPPDAVSKQAYLEVLSRGTLPVQRTESRL